MDKEHKTGKKHGGAREGAGRSMKEEYALRKTGAWNVEAWIPPALQELCQEKAVKSASDVVNESLKALCHIFGKKNPEGLSTGNPDPFQTARWRFFSDEEMKEVVEAIKDRFSETKGKPNPALKKVWMSALEAFEPAKNTQTWRYSILDNKNKSMKNTKQIKDK